MRNRFLLAAAVLAGLTGPVFAQLFSPTNGPNFSGTPQNPIARIIGPFGESFLAINPDGSTNTRSTNIYPPITTVKVGCTAVNNRANVTITPPAGQYVYVLRVVFDITQDATGGSTAIQQGIATTNLFQAGSSSTAWEYNVVSTVNGQSLATVNETYPYPGTRSFSPGTAVTITPPANDAHIAQCFRVTYYFGT